MKDRVFRFKGSSPDIDLKDYALRPTVTDSSEKETVRFLSYAGLSMNEKEQISVIRAMTTFLKVFDTDLHANRFKNLSIFGVGKVRERERVCESLIHRRLNFNKVELENYHCD